MRWIHVLLALCTAAVICGCMTYTPDPNSDDPDLRRRWILEKASSKDDLLLVQAFLQDSDPLVRSAAVSRLGRSGNLAYASRLRKMLNDVAEPVRLDTIKALERLRDRGADALLKEKLLTDQSALVRVRIAKALGDSGVKNHVRTLVKGLVDVDMAVRHACWDALKKLTGHTDRGMEPDAWKQYAERK